MNERNNTATHIYDSDVHEVDNLVVHPAAGIRLERLCHALENGEATGEDPIKRFTPPDTRYLVFCSKGEHFEGVPPAKQAGLPVRGHPYET